jgi:L-aminopeptidase/D-esterase-like protein
MRALIITTVFAWLSMSLAAQPARSENATLTAVPGLKVGHFTLSERPSGCTVVLTEAGAIGGVDVRGAAPGTRETDLLNPVNSVESVHAIVFAGGSAFGLDAASGVMRFLDERGIGFKVTSHGIPVTVPIVPAAVLIGSLRFRPASIRAPLTSARSVPRPRTSCQRRYCGP